MSQLLVIDMEDSYPFGQCDKADNKSVKVQVRRIFDLTFQDRNVVLSKLDYFRRLNHNCLICLQSSVEEVQNQIQLMYEYVPIRVQTWLTNINEDFIESFCKQLIEFGQYLAKCYIITELKLKNIGMDQNYKAKYFLDLKFAMNDKTDKNTLFNRYQQDVINMFRPYIQRQLTNKAINYKAARNLSQNMNKDNSPQKYNNKNKVDTLESASVRKIRQRAGALLSKQRKNESLSIKNGLQLVPSQKHRKQSILSSVSHVRIGKIGRRIQDFKNKLKHYHSPEPVMSRTQHSFQAKNNKIAFNYGTTEKFITQDSSFDSASIYKGIFNQLKQEENLFQKLQKNFVKQLSKGLPLKKNQTLKAKEYQQMKKSDDVYFKDFFQVLDDKPKLQIQAQERRMLTYQGQQQTKTKDNNKGGDMHQLQSRVKDAINRSKNLINKFRFQK